MQRSTIFEVASRRPLVALAVVVAIGWLAADGSRRAPASGPRVQAAVLSEGFAVIDGTNRIVELDDDATRRHEMSADVPAGARVVGLPYGVGAVWRDGKQIAIARLDSDGTAGHPQRFGRRVHTVCEGVATSGHQFAVAWTESDGALRFLHGPTSRAAEVRELSAELGIAAKSDRCWVTSAGDKIALSWMDGKRMFVVICGRQCSRPRRFGDLPRNSTVLGFGCMRDGCAVATRTPGGVTSASWFVTPDKAVWTKPLPNAAPDTRVELVGTGSQIALAYATANEPVVVVANKSGALAAVWQAASDAVPGLVWARGNLLIARHTGGTIEAAIVAIP